MLTTPWDQVSRGLNNLEINIGYIYIYIYIYTYLQVNLSNIKEKLNSKLILD